jgi:hypothetical protein
MLSYVGARILAALAVMGVVKDSGMNLSMSSSNLSQ